MAYVKYELAKGYLALADLNGDKIPNVQRAIRAWLPPEIEKDAKDFVRTGSGLSQSAHWTETRQPFLLETSHPGVFAAGDVRSGSVKRVASAVGEGAMAVQFVHQYLREM